VYDNNIKWRVQNFKDKLSKITATYDCKHDSNSRAEVLCHANISNPTNYVFMATALQIYL